MRIRNPHVVVSFMLVGVTVFTVLAWRFGFSPLIAQVDLQQDAPSFRSTNGTILQRETVARVSGGSSRGGGGHVYYVPVVTYEYEVGGIAFRSSTLQPFSPSFRTRGEADAHVSEFVPGAAVAVYHDAVDPERAVLRTAPGPKAPLKKAMGMGFAAFLCLFWLILLVIAWRLWFARGKT